MTTVELVKSPKFYTFSQNNSGGWFVYDDNSGIAHFVIIEAYDAVDANKRANDTGIYFDNDFQRDCGCCGRRWYEADDWSEISEFPTVYGYPASSQDIWDGGVISWRALETGEPGVEIWVHHLDGSRVGYGEDLVVTRDANK